MARRKCDFLYVYQLCVDIQFLDMKVAAMWLAARECVLPPLWLATNVTCRELTWSGSIYSNCSGRAFQIETLNEINISAFISLFVTILPNWLTPARVNPKLMSVYVYARNSQGRNEGVRTTETCQKRRVVSSDFSLK